MTLGSTRYDARPWGERLKTWRENVKHWSRTDFKEQVEATSYKLREPRGNRLDVRLIARWEAGEVKCPQGVYLRILAQMGAPLPNDGATLANAGSEDDDMNRRRFLQSAGAAVAAAVAKPEASYGGRTIPVAKVDPGDIREIRAAVDRLYVQDQALGGATLAQAALEQYYDARHMLDEGDYGEDVGRELMTIAGELAVCVGWLSYDAGNQGQARELYSEAFLLADQAANSRLAFQAIEKMALQSVYIADRGQHRGTAREAIRLSTRLNDLARLEPSPRLHALVGGRQAIAHAVTGDEQSFRSAIVRSWREIERADSVDVDETWLQFVGPSEITVHEAKGYRYLGNPALAAQLYRASLEDKALSPRNRVNYQAQLAATLATLGDTRGAIDEGVDVLRVLQDTVASPRTVTELAPIRQIARVQNEEEFCSRFDRVMAKVV